MIVENQKNIKVHFAGCEVINQFVAIKELGIKYTLYTAYPFLERRLFKKAKSPLMPCYLKDNPNLIPNHIMSNSKHCIQDSGLFTLMFGSQKGDKDEKFLDKWYNELVSFSNEFSKGITIVEIDCQKVLGVKKAWEYRQNLKRDLPNNRQINVFHKEDGIIGLDRLIEFSDYIAISIPELRFLGKKWDAIRLAHYIKNKKPSIDIHLLGCTDLSLLKDLKFCSSSDSTTYTIGKRYGYMNKKHIKYIDTKKILEKFDPESYQTVNKWNNVRSTNFLLLSIYYHYSLYNQYLGDQS